MARYEEVAARSNSLERVRRDGCSHGRRLNWRHILLPVSTLDHLSTLIIADSHDMHECPLQMQSPATFRRASQLRHFRGLISSRHRDACRPDVTGFRVGLSANFIDSSALRSRLHTTPETSHARVARLTSRRRSSATVLRVGMMLKPLSRVVTARSPQARPQGRGAHNSKTSMQQPNHQC
jgi:hypothetical protein